MASLASSVELSELSSTMTSTVIRSTAAEARALKVHSEAERRRRDKINAHLATLRTMITDATQMDKATLLASVVSRVKHLKRRATETTASPQGTAAPIPPEANEVTVQCYTTAGDGRATYIRAEVSCDDDRPGLFADLAGAFRGLGLTALRAEVASLGGRAHHVFVLCREDGGVDNGGARGLRSLEEGVRRALAEISFPEMVRGGSSGRLAGCGRAGACSGFDRPGVDRRRLAKDAWTQSQ